MIYSSDLRKNSSKLAKSVGNDQELGMKIKEAKEVDEAVSYVMAVAALCTRPRSW